MEVFASGIAMNILGKEVNERRIALPDIKLLKATIIKIVKFRGHWCMHRQLVQENKSPEIDPRHLKC